MITPDEYLNVEDASKLLSLAKSTMYKLTCRREIPHCKRGKYLYFSRQELNAWIKEGRIKTMEEIEIEANTYIVTHKRKY